MKQPYATGEDFERLGLPARALVNVTDETIDAHLVSASAMADEFLSLRYALPLKSWDESLTRRVCDIAAYLVMGHRGYNPEDPTGGPLRQRYDDAMRWLADVREHRVNPAITSSSPPEETKRTIAVSSNTRRGW